MSKSPDAFRSIGEVSRLVGVAPHVLRYWETQFTQLSPVKRADGRRYYRPDDMRLVAGLCQVMREEGLSIRGARLLIAADRGAGLREIGAARLGETLAEAPPPVEPAPKKPRPVSVPAESLPLFAATTAAPVTDWLGRLVATAAVLRLHDYQGKPLPAQAKTLRDALRSAH